MDVLRLSSREGSFLQGSQCSRLRENTGFRTVIRTILHGMPVDAANSTPLRLEVEQRLAERADCKTSAGEVIPPRKDSPANAVNSTAARCSKTFDQDSSSQSVCLRVATGRRCENKQRTALFARCLPFARCSPLHSMLRNHKLQEDSGKRYLQDICQCMCWRGMQEPS
jgi:hypothetical protein